MITCLFNTVKVAKQYDFVKNFIFRGKNQIYCTTCMVLIFAYVQFYFLIILEM
jgi:hypothetical protein